MPSPTSKHPVDVLREELDSWPDEAYPVGVAPVPRSKPIAKCAFFPAGDGLWNPEGGKPALPERPIMVLGHNWGPKGDYEEYLGRGYECPAEGARCESTWRNLLKLLDTCGIDRRSCFYTNAMMGLLEREASEGDFPGCNQPQYLDRWADFLRYQLRTVKPRLVLCMGDVAPNMLGRSLNDRAGWLGRRGGWKSLADLLRDNLVVHEFAVPNCASLQFVAVAVHHPCREGNFSPRFGQICRHVQRGLSVADPYTH